MRTLWMVADASDGSAPQVAAQYAQLFGLKCRLWKRDDLPDRSVKPADTVIALSYRAFRSLDSAQTSKLRGFLRAGATIYIRGGFAGNERCSLWPLVNASFSCGGARAASAYRVETHPCMPYVLHGEETAPGELLLPSALSLPETARPLASARFLDGQRQPFLFSVDCGAGKITCDLLPDCPIGPSDLPIFDRLADPARRYAELGALQTLRLAAQIDPAERPALNLTIDDRPANFDYLTARKLERWLRHLDERWPGVHVDFAWTPDQLRPARAFVEILKRFNTGVVWHGFKHHVDHRRVPDLGQDLRDGSAMVARISREFGVRFQPIMVFPFEAFSLESLPLLEAAGFLATFANHLAPVGLWSPFPTFMDYSVPLHEQFAGLFPVLRRSPCEALTRDRMLAHVLLNLPMIVVIHPDEVGLRRWPYPPLRQGWAGHCDKVLSLAAGWRLRPHSLEEIVPGLIARPRPQVIQPSEFDVASARQVH